MTKLQIKSIIYQLVAFLILFIPLKYVLKQYTNLTGYFIPLTALVIVSIIAPKFQSVKTNSGEKMFMKWIFIKGIKEIK